MIQSIRYSDGKPAEGCDLNDGYHLRTLYEVQRDADHYTRISRVVPEQDGYQPGP